MEKQIEKKAVEEMTKHCAYYHNGNCKNTHPFVEECDLMCDMFGTFANLDKAGYRKQVEGVWTFNQDGSGTCSNCHFTQKGVWDYDNHQHFCGVCGAKMKGGE